ncbi:MAG: alpha/beta hydrolase [Nocardioides sp.]
MIGSALLRRTASTAAAKAQKTAFHTIMALPEPAMRAFAGDPIVVDGQELATDTQAMLKMMKISRQPDLGEIPVPAARRVMRHAAQLAGGDQTVGRIQDFWVHGHKARLYVPSGAAATPGPLMVFLHGGGFIFGDIESHDAPCRFLAENAGVRILSVNYRLGPEAPFPAAWTDAVGIFTSVLERAEEFGADPGRIGVGGDSAGGNLAGGIALEFKDKCAFQFLIYPTTTADHATRSYELFREGFFLTTAFMDAAARGYMLDVDLREDPRVVLMGAQIPENVAPAYIATAGFDPLRDEGEDYARKLMDAGVQVEVERFPDQIHGFLNCVGAGPTHKAAAAHLAEKFKELAGS